MPARNFAVLVSSCLLIVAACSSQGAPVPTRPFGDNPTPAAPGTGGQPTAAAPAMSSADPISFGPDPTDLTALCTLLLPEAAEVIGPTVAVSDPRISSCTINGTSGFINLVFGPGTQSKYELHVSEAGDTYK